jgi:Helix-turn-helix domain
MDVATGKRTMLDRLDNPPIPIEEAFKMLKISRSVGYELRQRGELTGFYTIGKRVFIGLKDLQAYIDARPKAMCKPGSPIRKRTKQA